MNCLLCADTGEVVTFYRGGEEPEHGPCSCPAGLALEAFLYGPTPHALTVPLGAEPPTIEDRNNER